MKGSRLQSVRPTASSQSCRMLFEHTIGAAFFADQKALAAGRLGAATPVWPLLLDIINFGAPPAVCDQLRADSGVAPALLEWAGCLGQALDALDAASRGAAASGSGSVSDATAATGPPPGLSTTDRSSPAAEGMAEDAEQQAVRQERAAQLADHLAVSVECWAILQGEKHRAHVPHERTHLLVAFARMARHIGSSPSMPALLYFNLSRCLHCLLGKVGSRLPAAGMKLRCHGQHESCTPGTGCWLRSNAYRLRQVHTHSGKPRGTVVCSALLRKLPDQDRRMLQLRPLWQLLPALWRLLPPLSCIVAAAKSTPQRRQQLQPRRRHRWRSWVMWLLLLTASCRQYSLAAAAPWRNGCCFPWQW